MLGKKFDIGKIGVIVENKEKYISFNIDVVVDSYKDDSGKVKIKKIQLRFINSFRFINSLTINLVGVSGIECDRCKGSFELTHIEDYTAHGKCRNC